MKSVIIALFNQGYGCAALDWRSLPGRLLAFAALAASEIVIVRLILEFPPGYWSEFDLPNAIWWACYAAPVATTVFIVLAWPKRHQLICIWQSAAAAQNWWRALHANGLLFLLLTIASAGLTANAATDPALPWRWLPFYCAVLALTGASLAVIAAPASAWWRGLRLAPLEAFGALCAAGLLLATNELMQLSWDGLATATLLASAVMLWLYEPGVVVDLATKTLGAADFRVTVYPPCSGYEGASIVLAIMVAYFWLFRAELQFPNVLLLLPIGIVAVWLLNVIRIAVLVSIGAHISPAVALGGFHSYAGSIAFALVTLALIAASHRISFFLKASRQCMSASRHIDRLLPALLLPFAALMAASLVTQLFSPNHHWLYGVKAIALGAVLWRFRDVYRSMLAPVAPLSIAAGAAVGIGWIVSDPGAADRSTLGPWLATLPLWLAAAWLAVRALGAVVLVPIAEELAFRGYLHRMLVTRSYTAASGAQFAWPAFVTTSLLFGVLHQRWIAGAVAGAVFAAVMYRSGRLAEPIAAHMTSNAIIVAWAIAAGQWTLL